MANKQKIPITQVHTGDRLQNEQQARTRDVTQVLNAQPVPLDARLIKNISVPSAASFVVKHKLGRKFTGWAVHRVQCTGSAPGIVETPQAPMLDGSQVTFTNTNASGGGVLADILFY
jgi:hypothetical protein